MEKSTTLSFLAGVQTATMPTDMVRARKAEWYTSASSTRIPLEFRQRENLDRIWGHWQVTSQGTPEFWTSDGYPGGGSHKMVLFPTPPTSGTVKLGLTGQRVGQIYRAASEKLLNAAHNDPTFRMISDFPSKGGPTDEQ